MRLPESSHRESPKYRQLYLSTRSALVCFVVLSALRVQPSLAAWSPNGVPLATAAKKQLAPNATTDGAGGAIVVWADSRTPGPYYYFDIYARRISPNGTPMWSDNGVPVCTMTPSDGDPVVVSDGFGGALIAWTQLFGSTNVYAQRIDGAGNPLWTVNGIKLNTTAGSHSAVQLVDDGSGGAIVAWAHNADIYARRITSTGSSSWTPVAIGVCVKTGVQAEPDIVSDGAGGAIICWSDSTNHTTKHDIYAQRITATGTLLWPAGGSPICTASDYQFEPRMFDEGAGGGIIVWREQRTRPETTLYMQRVNGAGVAQWAANGIPICAAPGSRTKPAYARFGDRFILAWGDLRNGNWDVYAQQFDMAGNAYWAADGVAICTNSGFQSDIRVTSDADGGAIIAWGDGRNASYDVYTQRVDNIGNVLWTPDGEVVVNAPGSQIPGGMTSDENGGAIIPWSDKRIGDQDIYVQHIGPYGPTVTAINNTPSATPLLIRPNYPNPFSIVTGVEFQLPEHADVALELFDVNGRRVRSEGFSSRPAGWNRIDVVAKDQGGHALPSGVYFLKISAAGASVTRKIVIAH